MKCFPLSFHAVQYQTGFLSHTDSDLRYREEGDEAVIFIVVSGYYTTGLLPAALK